MTVSSWKSSMRRWICATSQPTASPTATPARRDDDEPAARVRQREAAGRDRRDREAVGDEAGGVVDQALALEDGDDPPRHLAGAG